MSSTTGSNSGAVSSSIASLWTKIENEIKNFDGFEYYQYYNTGSDAYPKSGSSFPEPLLSTGSVEALKWLGSDNDLNQYYGEHYSQPLYMMIITKTGYITQYLLLLQNKIIMIIMLIFAI